MNVERAPNDQFVTYGENFSSLTSIKSQIKLSGSEKLNFSWFGLMQNDFNGVFSDRCREVAENIVLFKFIIDT